MSGPNVVVTGDLLTTQFTTAPDGLPVAAASPSNENSPHLVGYWPLSGQNYICAKDVSGNRRHFVSVNGSMNGIKADANGRLKPVSTATGRLVNSPSDPRFNLTQPGLSFLITVVHRTSDVAGSLTVLGCGASANGFYCGVIQNAAATRFRTVTGGTVTRYSSDFSAPLGTDTHIAVLRDGVAGMLYVFLNGEIDSGYGDGEGFAVYAPTATQTASNLALCGYGNNVTGADLGNSAPSQHTLGHLQLYTMPVGYNVDAIPGLIRSMSENYTRVLTREELP